VRTRDLITLRYCQARESGQAMVEFALILFPLLLLVAGIIQFGIALNYWLDMQRIANQGARWAAVNCTRSATTPPSYNPCSPNLQTTLKQQALSNGLRGNVCVAISFPSGTALKGDPVRVSLQSPFTVVPILGVGTIHLGAQATMRMEWTPTAFAATAPCP
jgi:Flp pilus assembly protein TadG